MSDLSEPEYIRFTVEKPVSYWCNLFNCEKEDLLQAMYTIGNLYAQVDSFLILNRKKKNTPPNV
jgi:hypothetical protein